MRTTSVLLSLAAATILFTGCGSEKPARTAIAQATESVEKIRPDASQYAPQELAVVEATLAHMKQDLANEKYAEVVKAVPQLNTEFATAVETANSTKTLTAEGHHEGDAGVCEDRARGREDDLGRGHCRGVRG
jgi:hypothetical protein